MNDDLIRIINDMISSFRNGAIEGAGAYIACTFLDKIKSFIKDRGNLFEYLNNRLSKDLKDKEIVEPERNILIPSMEGILLNEKETPLHEMFYNLLKSSMDKNSTALIHPAFIQILKQMSPEEAKALLDISNNINVYRTYKADVNDGAIVQIHIDIKYDEKIVYDNNMDYDCSYIFKRLETLGLIFIEDSTKTFTKIIGGSEEFNGLVKDKIKLTKFGLNFMEICYNDECKKLLEIIDIRDYLKNVLKK